MNENFQKLPPELQARINNIVNQAAANNAPAAQAPEPTQLPSGPPQQMQPAQPPAPRPPSARLRAGCPGCRDTQSPRHSRASASSASPVAGSSAAP